MNGPAEASSTDAPNGSTPAADGANEQEQNATSGASFEASAERLARIVEALEAGDRSLEQSLALFEEGVRVARAAQQRLDQAERRVEELLGLDEQGQPRTRELDA